MHWCCPGGLDHAPSSLQSYLKAIPIHTRRCITELSIVMGATVIQTRGQRRHRLLQCPNIYSSSCTRCRNASVRGHLRGHRYPPPPLITIRVFPWKIHELELGPASGRAGEGRGGGARERVRSTESAANPFSGRRGERAVFILVSFPIPASSAMVFFLGVALSSVGLSTARSPCAGTWTPAGGGSDAAEDALHFWRRDFYHCKQR